MRCLIIGKVWPEPSSTAAGRRTLDLVETLLSTGWQVDFGCAARRSEHACDLCALGVREHRLQLNHSGFDDWISALDPDVVIFDRFMTEEQFGWRVAEHCPEALRVLDTSDLHCLRAAREEQLKRGDHLRLRNETALREVAAIFRSDLTMMISEFEMDLLNRELEVPDHLLTYWPFAVEPPEVAPSFEQREHFIMIGSLLHAPNLDAARWCRDYVWPQIRKELPRSELHCYGSYGERFAGELNSPERGFLFKGRAESALETMAQYRVNLAPLRYGAGLKGKVFDGFLSGTPTVMTPIAAEGIFIESDWGMDSAGAFSREAVKLYSHRLVWEERREREHTVCRERFDRAAWRQRLPQVLEYAWRSRQDHRKVNFVGQMLRHHLHRSMEFMSRWIEEKNRS
jgi:hypothetical protein